MKILAIDTSGKTASVALTEDGRLLWEKTVYTKLTHSQVILPMVTQAMTECGLEYKYLDCIAAAKGPGSYTGLRIGIGALKGLCMGEPSLRAAGVSTLLGLAYNCVGQQGRIVSVMRARPNIVYSAQFESVGMSVKRLTEDKVCTEEEAFADLGEDRIVLVGDCAEELKEKRFGDNPKVLCAAKTMLLQRASSLCMAVENEPQLMCSADELEVSYLQATKAEKDKAHR